jgi:hypothetical protein
LTEEAFAGHTKRSVAESLGTPAGSDRWVLPALVLAVVVKPDTGPDGASASPGGEAAVALTVYAKVHHLDDNGTVDALALGELAPRRISFDGLPEIARQVRAHLVEDADRLVRAFAEHETEHEISRDDVARIPLEVDLDDTLARQVGERFEPMDLRHPGGRREEEP